ncbi:hypothetical protein EV193_101236 [Herbihabitans rhizosphaerae]|uniref:YbaB/EbfC DNA-binding family protein n=1 Tax=Herbihabitans rhizosphaerae TaxID=1872711 RepID=A0A4Q7L6X2_9PSEU|nr:hypothetical protein [Herbihabitans rhizosphaerae]RZS44361.1 hypothetical protein EV193_101236 [Herbihabitans rhizosphaerae]
MPRRTLRLGFEEGDDEDRRPRRDQKPTTEDTSDAVAGAADDNIVTVHRTSTGEVVSVDIVNDWRDRIDPRVLGSHVVSAVNTAAMNVLAQQIEQIDPDNPMPPDTPTPTDETPLTSNDVLRLVDAVTADLDQFVEQAQQNAAIASQPVSATSAGGHVTGSAQNGQVTNVTLDSRWIFNARTPEIEKEILDALRQLYQKTTPANPVPQPDSFTEIMTLLVVRPSSLQRR